jgi:acyl homoserine lactone synthase
MIIAEHGSDADPDLLQQMFEMRAAAFGERRGWRVSVSDGKEIDEFDELNPLYLMCVDQSGQLLASLRLLQTTGPHMLANVFSDLLGEESVVRSPLVWESTRFCVNKYASQNYSAGGVNAVTCELLEALCTVGNKSGLTNIISVYDIFMERVLRRSGCIFEQYGVTIKYDDGLKTKAGLFDVSELALASIRRASALHQPPSFAGKFWRNLDVA